MIEDGPAPALDIPSRVVVARFGIDWEAALRPSSTSTAQTPQTARTARSSRPGWRSCAHRRTGSSARRPPTLYELTDRPGDRVVADLVRSGRLGGAPRLDAAAPMTGEPLGAIQLQTPQAPGSASPPADGRSLWLSGCSWGTTDYQVVDHTDRVPAEVERQGGYLDRIFSNDVGLGDLPLGGARLLVLIGVILLDQLGRRKKENTPGRRRLAG